MGASRWRRKGVVLTLVKWGRICGHDNGRTTTRSWPRKPSAVCPRSRPDQNVAVGPFEKSWRRDPSRSQHVKFSRFSQFVAGQHSRVIRGIALVPPLSDRRSKNPRNGQIDVGCHREFRFCNRIPITCIAKHPSMTSPCFAGTAGSFQ